jgi:hypothetical protein
MTARHLTHRPAADAVRTAQPHRASSLHATGTPTPHGPGLIIVLAACLLLGAGCVLVRLFAAWVHQRRQPRTLPLPRRPVSHFQPQRTHSPASRPRSAQPRRAHAASHVHPGHARGAVEDDFEVVIKPRYVDPDPPEVIVRTRSSKRLSEELSERSTC